jgi:transcriptional regulator with XRE-family HTH domain
LLHACDEGTVVFDTPEEPSNSAGVDPDAGPTARRRQLGLRLLALREARGWTAEEAGDKAGMSKATVSRYERAKGNVRWNQVDQLCRAYGAVDQERRALVELAKNSKVTAGWWVPYTGRLPSTMRLLLALEDEATRINQHAVGVVPGLLQTLEYARAIRGTPTRELPGPAVDDFLKMRMQRQLVLDRDTPPDYHVILDEAVIRRVVGGAEVMAAQLDRLLERGRQPHVTVQVLPFAAGAFSAALNSFIIYGGSDPALDVTYVENLAGSLFLEEAEGRDEYATAMAFLRQQALDPAQSAELIADVRASHLPDRTQQGSASA